jgi:prophage DNA circulation protein
MKKFLIALGYLAGVVVGAKYAQKNLSTTGKKGTKKSTTLTDQAIDAGKEILTTHQNALKEIKKEYWTPENKKLLLSKKDDLMKFLDLAKMELAETISELKKNGIDAVEIQHKIESIYAEKSGILKKL